MAVERLCGDTRLCKLEVNSIFIILARGDFEPSQTSLMALFANWQI